MTTYNPPKPASGIRWRRLVDYHGHNLAAYWACRYAERTLRGGK